MKKRVVATITTVAMISTLLSGCGNSNDNKQTTGETTKTETTEKKEETKQEEKKEDTSTSETKETTETTETQEVKHFKAWFDREKAELNQKNDIKDIITSKINADCWETWLVGQKAEEARGIYVASDEYPDFLNFDSAFYDAEALVPLDDYLDAYPNIKALWNDVQWESLRQADGHIYSIPQFGNIYVHSMDTQQDGEAFWIQNRVLKWANYPTVESLDQLFDLLRDYYAANPTMADGTPIIPFEILAYDWLYFGLENPPQFLDGFPNDGKCIVDPDTYLVTDYNTTPTAKKYFEKLNKEFKAGLIDPEFVTMNQDQFGEKVSTGRVLCFVSQHWVFNDYENAIKAAGLNDCIYVPLGITIEPGMKEMYYATNEAATLTGGLSITKDCKDVEGALQFVNDLLDPEILTLRMWGQKDVDYLVDDAGIFYRTQEMRDNAVKADYIANHLCPYSFFPQYSGMNPDLKNAATPDQQPGEFYDGLPQEVKDCLAAYGAKTYVEMLDNNVIDPLDRPWYPMWSYVNTLPADSIENELFNGIDNLKKVVLPQVVIADDFESAWADYMEQYQSKQPELFMQYMQEAVYSRVELVTGKNVRPEGYVAP